MPRTPRFQAPDWLIRKKIRLILSQVKNKLEEMNTMKRFTEYLSILLTLFLVLSLTGCVTRPLQAPCDQQATFCGKKTKINPW